MSANKFFSYGLLSLVRWESWTLWLLLVAAWRRNSSKSVGQFEEGWKASME
jgi:hypothetical protein